MPLPMEQGAEGQEDDVFYAHQHLDENTGAYFSLAACFSQQGLSWCLGE